MQTNGLTDESSSEFELDLYDEILARCQDLSSFQLYRLREALDQELNDPDRVKAIRQRIRPGDVVEYFDTRENRCIAALVKSCQRTRVSVKNVDDGDEWRVEYVSVNVNDDPSRKPISSTAALSRDQVAVGDLVGFVDRDNRDRIGKVMKRNPKTAGIQCDDGHRWRVPYRYLYSVLDADGNVKAQFQPKLTFDAPLQ